MKGLDLSEKFYFEVVKPLLFLHFPNLFSYTACLIGNGSEILGYDTEMSCDHDWGPRLLLFLNDVDLIRYKSVVEEMLKYNLPSTFCNYPTSFKLSESLDGKYANVHIPIDTTATNNGIIDHKVILTSVKVFLLDQLNFTIELDTLNFIDWLSFPQQNYYLLSVVEYLNVIILTLT